MSNLWFNIRFGCRHLQIRRDSPYVAWIYNPGYEGNPTGRWFEVYCVFGKHIGI